MTVTLGLERLLQAGPSALPGRRIGLVTNHTGTDRLLRQNADLMQQAGFELTALFGPEHGIRGAADAGAAVADARDPVTGLPAYSLYGSTKKPTREMLRNVDVLVMDIWDIGVRYYTFPYTMAYCMEAAGEAGIPFVLLDRPNPIGGTVLEGNLLQERFSSFVGRFPIPIRHGLTLGELARLFNALFHISCDLTVIPCEGWHRSMFWDATGHPLVPASPNTTGLEMALLYAGTCLFEGTNWSEGRGTAKPFEVIGAPWVDAFRWAGELNSLDLPGVRFRPAWFTPSVSKHRGNQCQGVQVHILDRVALKPVLTGLQMLASAFRLWPGQSQFLKPPAKGHPRFLDLLAGTDSVRACIEAGDEIKALYDSWEPELQEFARNRAAHLLYHAV